MKTKEKIKILAKAILEQQQYGEINPDTRSILNLIAGDEEWKK